MDTEPTAKPANTIPPAAEVDNYTDALEAGYFGHAPGAGNDHSLAAVVATAPGDQPKGEPAGTDNGGNASGAKPAPSSRKAAAK